MVPANFHTFFSDTAEVAGTLIGLLFVAVSLSPEKLGGDDLDFQVGAGVAFGALINGLLISLFALLPGENLGNTGIVLSAFGLSSALGLGVISLRHNETRGRLRVLFRVVGLLALFGIELGYSLDLSAHPHDREAVHVLALLIIFGFLFAIERAWELVGGGGASLLVVFARLATNRPAGNSAHRSPGPESSSGEDKVGEDPPTV